MVKGKTCCLKCLIIRQTKNCPKAAKKAETNSSRVKNGWVTIKRQNSSKFQLITITANTAMVAHLLITSIISEGWGLYLVLISAWRSGKNPSTTTQTDRATMPTMFDFIYRALDSESENSKSRMPKVTIAAIIILFLLRRTLRSTVRVQKTPTRTTDSTLQDSNITTTGKLVYMIAIIDSTEVKAFAPPHKIPLNLGIWVFYFVQILLQVRAQSQATREGMSTIPKVKVDCYSVPVKMFVNLSFILRIG